jgi:hypothetical protein
MRATAIPEMLNIPKLADAVPARLRVRSRATGVLVLSGFGALWAGAGVGLSSAPAWAWLVLAMLVVAFGVRVRRLLRASPPVAEPLALELAERQRRAGRIFAWTCAAEGVGILLAVNVVVNLGHPDWQAAAAMAVVGLHFLPLAVAFGHRPHFATGVAMTAWALAYPWLFAAGATAPMGLPGAGAILFASAAWALRSVAAR